MIYNECAPNTRSLNSSCRTSRVSVLHTNLHQINWTIVLKKYNMLSHAFTYTTIITFLCAIHYYHTCETNIKFFYPVNVEIQKHAMLPRSIYLPHTPSFNQIRSERKATRFIELWCLIAKKWRNTEGNSNINMQSYIHCVIKE